MKYRNAFKLALLSLLLILFYLLEEYALTGFRLFSVSPLLLPPAVAVIALFEGGMGGAAFGLTAGVMLDAGTRHPDGFFSVVLMTGAAAIGIFSAYMFKKNLINAMFMSLSLTGLTVILYFLSFYLFLGRADITGLLTVALPQILFSAAFTPAVYLPIWLISEKLFPDI